MDHRNAWQAAVGQLQMEMSRASYETWVQAAELVRYEGDMFTVGVPNAYACDWLKSRLTGTLKGILSGLMENPQQVEFIVWHKDYENQPQSEKAADSLPLITPRVIDPQPVVNHRYSFDNFVVGSSNRLAHAACMAVAENPAQAYNPLFLYGGVGLGKTHLLHAIGNYAQSQGQQVLYVSSEEFTNDLIDAIRAAYRGEARLHPQVMRKLMDQVTAQPSPQKLIASELTEREIEVLALVAQGMSNHEIAARLGISEKTVKTHVSNLLSKLGLEDRTRLAIYAIRNGLVPN